MYSTDEFDPAAEGAIQALVTGWKRQAEAMGYVTTRGAVPPEPTCETCRHRLHLAPDWQVELDWCLRRAPAFPVTKQGLLSLPRTPQPEAGFTMTAKPGRQPVVTDAQILAAYAEGLSLLDVALALSVGEKRVRRVVSQAGATRPNTGQNRYTKDHAKAARMMLEGAA